MRRILLSLALIISTLSRLVAQDDSLKFHSEIEKSAFSSIITGDKSIEMRLRILLSADPYYDGTGEELIMNRLNGALTYLKDHHKPGKHKKYSKALFSYVHENYLKKYVSLATFEDIFKNGAYNCASATALFALLTDEMKISNLIREQPNHVFMVIDPDNEKIVLESTDPMAGLYSLDPSGYVKLLLNMKMVSKEEAIGKSEMDIYYDYIGSYEKSISFNNLIGDLYHNLAIREADAGRMDTALQLIDKAYFLNHTNLTKVVRNGLIVENFIKTDIKDSSFFSHLDRLLKIEELKNDMASHAIAAFEKSGELLLLSYGEPETYEQIHLRLLTRFSDAGLESHSRDLCLMNYLLKVKYNWTLHNWENCLAYCDSALKILPNDISIQTDLASALGNYVVTKSLTGEELETLLEVKLAEYPFLKDLLVFRELVIVSKGIMVQQYFLKNKSTPGFETFEEFNSLIDQDGMSPRIQEMIGLVYGQISAFFIRERQIDKGKEWILEGLKIVPENHNLQARLRSVEDYERNYR